MEVQFGINTIQNYEIIGRLGIFALNVGEGTFGEVFRARRIGT